MTDDQDRVDAFEALYRSTLPLIRSYARRRTTADVAEDVVAHTYLTAWRRYDEAVAGGLPWLYRTAHLTLANHLRAERRQVRVADLVGSTADAWQPDGSDEHAERSVVLAAIQRLSEADRELLLLVYWERLSVKAVAVVLGCRPGTAAVRLHRARRTLREALSDPPDDETRAHPSPVVPSPVAEVTP
jgi:RNA polymerase sigma-70 factor (ECF subfamily)